MMLARKPRYRVDLVSLQAVCGANFARLCQLMPNMAEQDELRIDLAVQDEPRQSLVIRVLERCRYTTMLQLFHEHHHDWLQPPSMEVRMYHDVCMAEVVAAYNRRRFRGVYPYPNEQMLQPDEKHQLNYFLGEWLGFCRRHGLSSQSVPIGH